MQAVVPRGLQVPQVGVLVEVRTGPDQPRRQLSAGGYATAGEATAARAEVVRRARHGSLPTPAARRESVEQYLTRWLEAKITLGLRPTTARSYSGHITKYLVPELGPVRLSELRPAHVTGMLTKIRGRGGPRPVGPASQARLVATLRSALRDAVRDGDLPVDPCARVRLPPVPKPEITVWTVDELWRFADWLAAEPVDSTAAKIRPMVLLAAGSSLRLGEVVGLRWSDVDIDAGAVTVSRQATQVGQQVVYAAPKTASGTRRVSLGPSTVELLREHRAQQARARLGWGAGWAGGDLVFTPGPAGAPWKPFTVSAAFRRLVRAGKLPPASFHALRHLRVPVLLAAGVPMAVVSKMIGHSSVALTVNVYGHLDDATAREAAVRADLRRPGATA